jgi:hypothetical protein
LQHHVEVVALQQQQAGRRNHSEGTISIHLFARVLSPDLSIGAIRSSTVIYEAIQTGEHPKAPDEISSL